MLHLRPDLVRMDKAIDFRSTPARLHRGVQASRAPTARSSSAGRRRTSTRTARSAMPRRRPPRRGKAVVDSPGAAFVDLCRDVHAFRDGAAVEALAGTRARGAAGRARRHRPRRRCGDAEAEEPRLLLVLADPEAAPRRQARRSRRDAADARTRSIRIAARLRPPSRAADGARRRHRQLRPGGAARGRRRPRPERARPGRPGRARRGALRGRGAAPRHRQGAHGPERWELRFHPSTRKQATIGGFIAGGAAGCGSCTWGQIADPGAVHRASRW